MPNNQDSPCCKYHPLQLILLVVDGSAASENAAHFAVSLAAQTGARIIAVYDIDTAMMDYLLQMHILVNAEREDFEAALEAKGQSYLDFTHRIAEKAGVTMDTKIIRGRFHEEFARLADENKADMIVIGCWRYNARGKDTSAAERELLLNTTHTPVTIVR
jgi:nucleotide-binding universal stress UspA family protein